MIIPVCFIKNNKLMTTRRERDFLLCKSFDSISHDIDTWINLSEDIVSQKRPCQTAISPLSSLAFSSNTASLYESPSSCLARHRTDVVFPIPGMPEIITCGIFPSLAIIFNRSMVSVLPTISSRKIGRYFSTLESIFGQSGFSRFLLHIGSTHQGSS